jgi:hypothetical protein
MQNEFQYRTKVRPDPKADGTNVSLEISAQAIFRKLERFNWENYVRECRRSLHRVAAQESMDLVVWSIDLDFDRESVFHHVRVRGALRGMSPVLIIRALRPPPGYWNLDFLTRGLERGWRVGPDLKAHVEWQRLKRHDRSGKRLADPIPQQLLARALTETNWRLLISPSDSPWAYINTATQRMYERHYEETVESEKYAKEIDQKLSYKRIASGDELQLEDTPALWRAADLNQDSVQVLRARATGKKWHELPEYLTNQTGASFDGRRVEAARGALRRGNCKLCATAIANTKWKPPSTGGTVYKERLPDGEPWNGLWTYAHRYRGEELEVLGDLARQEWNKLFRKT